MNAEDRNDSILREIEIGLNCLNGVEAGAIHVTVEAGVVTLRGQVDVDLASQAAEHFASRVGGVRTVQNEIQVRRHPSHAKHEASLVRAVFQAFGPKHHDHAHDHDHD